MSRTIFFPSNTLIYGISRDGSKNFNIRTCEHMILGQLRMGARQAKNVPLNMPGSTLEEQRSERCVLLGTSTEGLQSWKSTCTGYWTPTNFRQQWVLGRDTWLRSDRQSRLWSAPRGGFEWISQVIILSIGVGLNPALLDGLTSLVGCKCWGSQLVWSG